MQQREYDEYEVVETDHDEAQVLDAQMATQADEHFMSWEQEQAFLRSIDNHVNMIYPSKATIKREPVGGQTHD